MKLSTPVVGLSPMDGVTDVVFREICRFFGPPDLFFTEFVSAEGLTRGGIKLYDQLLFLPDQRPIIGQLFGKDPNSFYKAAIVLAQLGFDGIDLNMGCPAKTVVQHGSGAALIDQPKLAGQLITSVQKGLADFKSKKITVADLGLNQKTLKVIKRNIKFSQSQPHFNPTISVKTRLGTNSFNPDWFSYLLKFNLDFITLHTRTLKQGYGGTADWSKIKQLQPLFLDTTTKFFGNGDIHSRAQALEYIAKYHLTGVLIGRSALGNPWLFKDYTPSPPDRFSAMLHHAQIFQDIFPARRFETLRKHFLAYTKGLSQAKQLRSHLVKANTIKDVLDLETHFQA